MGTVERRARMTLLSRQWANRHPCGVGSQPENVHNAKRILQSVIHDLDVKTMLDAGCGDQSWVREVTQDVDYTGIDPMDWTAEVKVLDFVSEPLPKVDLIFCRTVLIHLNPEDVIEALANFRRSCDYLLVTHDPNGDNAGSHLPVGEPWNLAIAPFNLGPPLSVWYDHDNHLALWGFWD